MADKNICSPGLDIIIGSMYSGKSSELLRRLSTVAEVGIQALYINNKMDNRNADAVFSSHNKILKSKSFNEYIKFISVNKLEDVSEHDLQTRHIIGIDEAQFFDNLDLVKKWIEEYRLRVIIAGLDGDYNRNKFGCILDLIPYCDSIIKLTAYCMDCAGEGYLVPALFTHRIKKSDVNNVDDNTVDSTVDDSKDNTVNNVDSTVDDSKDIIIDVGAHDKYQALCRSCYDEKNRDPMYYEKMRQSIIEAANEDEDIYQQMMHS